MSVRLLREKQSCMCLNTYVKIIFTGPMDYSGKEMMHSMEARLEGGQCTIKVHSRGYGREWNMDIRQFESGGKGLKGVTDIDYCLLF